MFIFIWLHKHRNNRFITIIDTFNFLNGANHRVPVTEQQRAREAVDWRTYEEEQQKLQEEQNVIELKQKVHLEEYKKERAELAHLSWKQRKSALYRANKSKFAMRPSERTQTDWPSLPLIIKGTPCSDRLL